MGEEGFQNFPSPCPLLRRGEGLLIPSLDGRGKGEGDNILKLLAAS